ncbi:unnamed protein product [Staurois parvus]|uniref:Uncharacterized protein n=1 Tax=Staurois parvus TaxID=386267 RepID=A0ABN9HP84_9NEOB|nr:unnamed protein product [Staurois parvus]
MTSSQSHCACAAQGARIDRWCAVSLGHSGSPIHGKSQRCRLGHHHLSVSISASCQCSSVPRASAHQYHINATYQCPSELPFSVTHQCQSVPPINVNQCHLSMPISAA